MGKLCCHNEGGGGGVTLFFVDNATSGHGTLVDITVQAKFLGPNLTCTLGFTFSSINFHLNKHNLWINFYLHKITKSSG
jgi:hypothetical protein